MFEFHSWVATLPASKAYNSPGTGGLFSASPLVATVAQSTPVPAASPLAESVRMPPGQIWLPTGPVALGAVANVVPLNANDLSASFTPQSYSSGPPLALERCQYTGPPRNSEAEIWIVWMALTLSWPRPVAVLSRYRTPVLPPATSRLVPGTSMGPELVR